MTQPPTTKPQQPMPKMHVKFFLRHGAVVDWPVPDPANFSLQFMVANIRSSGHFSAPDLYIPHDEIACIGLDSGTFKVQQPQGRAH